MTFRIPIVFVFVVGLFTLSGGIAAQRSDASPQALLRAATDKEVVDGDLPGAIKLYQDIVDKYGKTDRPVAAQALLRMAGVHLKLGDTQSTKIYQLIVSTYPDQRDALALAQRGLASRPSIGRGIPDRIRTGTGPIGAVSPDGQYAVGGSRGNPDSGYLALTELATGTERLLAPAGASIVRGPDWPEESAFSRDGKQVAYSRWTEAVHRYEVWVANVTGDPNPRRLFANEKEEAGTWLTTADWSPDGKWLALGIIRNRQFESVGLLSTEDGAFRILKRVEWSYGPMAFSPDGKYLGLTRLAGTGEFLHTEVSVIPTDGGDEVAVAQGPGSDFFVGWSPDGKTLLFQSRRTGSDALYGIGFAAGKPQGAPSTIRTGFSPSSVLGMTPAGRLYYMVSPAASSQIDVSEFDFDTGRWRMDAKTLSGVGFSNAPDWSPDGQFVAYVKRNDATGWRDLVIRAANGGQERTLPQRGVTNAAWWSPDGRTIAINSGDIFRIDVQSGEGTKTVSKPEGAGLELAGWSKDGKTLFYYALFRNNFALMARDLFSGTDRELIRLVGNPNITRVSADGTKLYYRASLPAPGAGLISGRPDATEFALIERDLASNAERELIRRARLGEVNLSPDGRYIVTGSPDVSAKSSALLLVPVAGGDSRELIRVSDPDMINVMRWAWSRDSRSFLAFKRRQGQPWETWWVPIDGRSPHAVESKPGMQADSLRVHPDGRRIAYASGGAAPSGLGYELWALDNFLPSAGVKP